jgi:hypothetical protein
MGMSPRLGAPEERNVVRLAVPAAMMREERLHNTLVTERNATVR